MKKKQLGITSLALLAFTLLCAWLYTIVNEAWALPMAGFTVIGSVLFICVGSVFLHSLLSEDKGFPKAKIGFIISDLVLFATAAICWVLLLTRIGSQNSTLYYVILISLAVAFTIWFFTFTAILWKYQGEIGTDFLSNIRVFVLSDIFLGLSFSGIAIAFAILSKHDEGFIILSVAVALSYIPASILTLLGAFIYYLRNSKKRNA